MWPFQAPDGRSRYALASTLPATEVSWRTFRDYIAADLLSDGPHYDERRFLWTTYISEGYGTLRGNGIVWAKSNLFNLWG